MMHQPRLLTCKVPERQPEERLNGCWVFERHLVPVRPRRDLFITFRASDVDEARHLDQKLFDNYLDASDERAASSKRQPTSSSKSRRILYMAGISPQRTKAMVSCAEQTNDPLRRSQTFLGRGVDVTGGNQTAQLVRSKTSAGDEFDGPRVVGLPGKEWIRLVRANPQDPVLRRLSIKNNSLSCAASIDREENRSIGSRPESSFGCGSLNGKKFPTLRPLPSQTTRTKPFNAAIGARNRSSVSSLFQQSCERIFASNRCKYHWTVTGNDMLFQKQRQQKDEEDEELTRLAFNRFEYEYFVSKTPNNSPTPYMDIVINDNEVRVNDIADETENSIYDTKTMTDQIKGNRISNPPNKTNAHETFI